MEQIYYTQCPVGYGLGASNGFQVKRLSPGYPVSGDFRHLGMRAFLPGVRRLAPATLRYRIEDDARAEVAFLTPRTHEYQTERGPWGRPGGHFAHGLLLDEAAMRALHRWPAGLFGNAFWKRSDPEPSLGRTPEPIENFPGTDGRVPSYATAASLASGTSMSRLAGLLTALASAARDGRTLFLIGPPETLADAVALLTLAFPETWRGGITFSTYHDRPEELHGFRLQGTAPDPRLNRAALFAQGFLADLMTGSIEPAITPARWAMTLAEWLVNPSDLHQDAWESTDRRASDARDDGPAGRVWSDDRLDLLYDLPARLRRPVSIPSSEEGWMWLGRTAAWAIRAGFAKELVEARGSSWWREQAGGGPSAWKSLLAHLQGREGWGKADSAVAWGGAVAAWLDRSEPGVRLARLGEAVGAAPAPVRPEFVRAML